MLWIIQNNLYDEEGYVKFIDALERLACDYLIVKPIPFTNQFLPADFDSMTQEVDDVEEPYIDTDQKIIVMGATSLSRIAKARGWTPGTYLNENFDFSKWRDGFGAENILNAESIVAKISDPIDVTDMSDMLFVRPVDDSKAFTGMTMSKHDFHDWILQMSVIEEEEFQPLHKNTKIAIANAKKIYAEYRLFVVCARVVTASMYKNGNTVHYSENVDERIIQFGQSMVRWWQETVDSTLAVKPKAFMPAPAYVIDIADTPDGLKVIEINNINSAGFYAGDCQKIIMAIEDMERFYE
jgi:hypothetical protein